jgi:hypothetical protein
VDDPTIFLKPTLPPEESWTNGFANPLDIFNYLSPSAWANSLIEKLTGVDIFGWATECLAGEWQALWKFGDAMGNLARCVQQIGINIQQGMLNLDRTWDGNASDAAYLYFSNLAATTSGQQVALSTSQDSYHDAAKAAWLLAEQLGNLLQAIGDKAILAGISAAAGTATAETGVGAVAGYGIAAYLVLDMLRLVNDASMIINTAGAVVLGTFGAVRDATAQINHLGEIRLPEAAFSGPGA